MVELNKYNHKESMDSSVHVINNFVTISINPNIVPIKKFKEDNPQFITRIDIIKSNYTGNEGVLEPQKGKERWLRLSTNGNFWLRMFISNKYNKESPPITSIKHIECEELNSEYIVS